MQHVDADCRHGHAGGALHAAAPGAERRRRGRRHRAARSRRIRRLRAASHFSSQTVARQVLFLDEDRRHEPAPVGNSNTTCRAVAGSLVQQLVRAGGVLDAEPVTDQPGHVGLSTGDQVDDGFLQPSARPSEPACAPVPRRSGKRRHRPGCGGTPRRGEERSPHPGRSLRQRPVRLAPTKRIASCSAGKTPLSSMATSAPRPSVRSRTARATSGPGAKVSAAPSSTASSRRAGTPSTTMTCARSERRRDVASSR